MRLKYEAGELRIDLIDLLDHVPLDQKRGMIESLSCQDDVIDFVTQQILDGWTESGFHGAVGSANPIEHYGLGKAWREVAKRSREVAAKEIERLEKALAESQRQYGQLLIQLRELEDKRNGRRFE